eukprot:1952446-Alexandrium_andersonii.AAC.1
MCLAAARLRTRLGSALPAHPRGCARPVSSQLSPGLPCSAPHEPRCRTCAYAARLGVARTPSRLCLARALTAPP